MVLLPCVCSLASTPSRSSVWLFNSLLFARPLVSWLLSFVSRPIHRCVRCGVPCVQVNDALVQQATELKESEQQANLASPLINHISPYSNQRVSILNEFIAWLRSFRGGPLVDGFAVAPLAGSMPFGSAPSQPCVWLLPFRSLASDEARCSLRMAGCHAGGGVPARAGPAGPRAQRARWAFSSALDFSLSSDRRCLLILRAAFACLILVFAATCTCSWVSFVARTDCVVCPHSCLAVCAHSMSLLFGLRRASHLAGPAALAARLLRRNGGPPPL